MEERSSGNALLDSNRFSVRVGEKAHTVRTHPDGSEISIDGTSHSLNITATGGASFSLLLDSSSFEVELLDMLEENGEKLLRIKINGSLFDVTVEDYRSQIWKTLVRSGEARSSKTVVKAPMPGKVVRVEVRKGEKIRSGQGLCVLEAMKMENEIKSPVAGIVDDVQVDAGKPVEKGEILVSISPVSINI